MLRLDDPQVGPLAMFWHGSSNAFGFKNRTQTRSAKITGCPETLTVIALEATLWQGR